MWQADSAAAVGKRAGEARLRQFFIPATFSLPKGVLSRLSCQNSHFRASKGGKNGHKRSFDGPNQAQRHPKVAQNSPNVPENRQTVPTFPPYYNSKNH